MIALLLACVSFLGPQSNGLETYKIGAQDVLAISVWEQPTLTGSFTVEADGTLVFPLVGRVKAAGRTVRELETEITRLLADGFLRRPQVSIGVSQFKSQQIYILGDVRAPGTYPLTGEMTVIEALARAGGVSTPSGEVLVVRPRNAVGPLLPGQDETAEVIRIDMRKFESGDLSLNIKLRNGDTIHAPKPDIIYVFGQVKAPGAYPVQKETTVLQALSLAGGLTEFGSTNRIKIVRFVNGVKKEVNVKLGDVVRPGDTIIVRERFF